MPIVDIDYPPTLRPRQKKKLHNYCFQFLQGITGVPREIEDNGYANSWANKVYYGQRENSGNCYVEFESFRSQMAILRLRMRP